jgi:hypothetical protein
MGKGKKGLSITFSEYSELPLIKRRSPQVNVYALIPCKVHFRSPDLRAFTIHCNWEK